VVDTSWWSVISMFTDVDGSWTEVGSVMDSSCWSVISVFTDVDGS